MYRKSDARATLPAYAERDERVFSALDATTAAGKGTEGRPLAAGAIFAVSGFAALVYPVSWQRILVLHSGVGIASIAMIVSGFLAGLGKRVGPRGGLRAFALLESSPFDRSRREGGA